MCLSSIYDKSLQNFEKEERLYPSERKKEGSQVTYKSRILDQPIDNQDTDRFVLCDFGLARFGQAFYFGDAQPLVYRAPEVLLKTAWDEKIDIWALGLVVRFPIPRASRDGTN